MNMTEHLKSLTSKILPFTRWWLWQVWIPAKLINIHRVVQRVPGPPHLPPLPTGTVPPITPPWSRWTGLTPQSTWMAACPPCTGAPGTRMILTFPTGHSHQPAWLSPMTSGTNTATSRGALTAWWKRWVLQEPLKEPGVSVWAVLGFTFKRIWFSSHRLSENGFLVL